MEEWPARAGGQGERGGDPEGLHANIQPPPVLQELRGAGLDRALAAGVRVLPSGHRVQAGHDGPSGRAAALPVLRSVATGREGELRGGRRVLWRRLSAANARCAGRASALSGQSVSPRGGDVPEHTLAVAAQDSRVLTSSDLLRLSRTRLLFSPRGSIRATSRLLCIGDCRFDSRVTHGSSHAAGPKLGSCTGKPS